MILNKLRPISKKRHKQLKSYRILAQELREKCGNVSELTGDNPDWQTDFQVEPHHITGRTGKKLLDPMNIIMVTRSEHEYLQKHMSYEMKNKLLNKVKKLRC